MYFFFQAEDGIRDRNVTGVQTCALPIWARREERRGQTVAVPALGVAADAPRVIDLAPQGQEIRAARDVHDRDPDRLRLEHFAPEIGRASCRERVEIGVGGDWVTEKMADG